MPFVKLNIQSNSTKCIIHYKTIGRGKPFIFIHGWNGAVDSFQLLNFSSLSKKYKIYLIDLPGYGKSSEIETYSFTNLCKIIGKFLKKKKIERATFLGVCMGALICLDFYIRNPPAVEELFLIEPSFVFPKILKFLYPIVNTFPPLGNFLFYLLARNETGLMTICYFLTTNKRIIHSYLLKTVGKSSSRTSIDYMKMLYKYSKINHYERIEKTKGSTKCVVFIGSNTGKDIKETSNGIQRVMKNCKVAEIRNSSHFPMSENPRDFEREFLREIFENEYF